MQGHAFNNHWQQQISQKNVSNKNFQNCGYMRLVFFVGGLLQLDPMFDTQWWSPTYQEMFDGKYVDLRLL